ncbi:MAG TPA: DoxX family protein [Chitinophagaceae bacterium]|nr:DoxX family protein [Chitinophagaceae bacterium]
MKNNTWIRILQICIGILFLVSGILKANDPIGLSEKMQEILHSWNINFLDNFTLFSAFFIICVEVVLGIAFILSIRPKISVSVAWIFISFFLVLTGIATFTGSVDTCGCFGDCLPLSTKQSFIKNIFLWLILFTMYKNRKIFPVLILNKTYVLFLFSISLIITLFTSWWAIEHLPFIDCSIYKKGKSITEINKNLEIPNYNKQRIIVLNGQDTLQWNNIQTHHAAFIKNKQIVILDSLPNGIDKISSINIPFYLFDSDLNDFTNIVLKDPGYNFILLIKNKDFKKKNIDKIPALIQTAIKNNIGFYIASSISEEETRNLVKEYNLENAQILYIDYRTNKQIIRNNPGLIILKAGTIKGKWSYSQYPSEVEWKHHDAIKVK